MKLRVPKISFWRVVLAIVWTLGVVVAYKRFFHGLGSVTNLSDQFPWGVWIGFDILVGVGLAAGGFAITAIVYVFNLKEFKPISRPTVLTAFLGYLLVIGALMFDLGKPFNVWHPIIMWNPHSVMFEVGWCVMLYTTVLFLEFSPIILEKFGLKKPLKLVRTITLPLVILGVLLSTLHQSSLGTLYVIVPDKLHPLWYSGFLPVFFFVSSIGGGLAMVIFESYLSARAFGKQLEFSILAKLGRVIVVVLSLWLFIRFLDLVSRDALAYMIDGSRESLFFLGEILLGGVLPIVLFSIRGIRKNRAGLYLASVFVIFGFVANRLNVAITGMIGSAGVNYIPSWEEMVITISLVMLGFVIFRFAVQKLAVFEKTGVEKRFQPPLVIAGKSGHLAMGVLVAFTLFVLAAIGYGFSKLSQEQLTQEDKTARLLPIEEELNFPDPIKFEMSEDSPGPVTFNHETHVDPDEPNCKNCHQDMFKIRPTRAGELGTVDMELLYEHKQCGSCHDGESAFSVDEGCEFCHMLE